MPGTRTMNHRGRVDIIADMLTSAKHSLEGVTKTKMMYDALLSSTQVKEYLQVLLARQLLNHDSATRKYRLAKNGVEYLEMYHQTRNIMENSGKVS